MITPQVSAAHGTALRITRHPFSATVFPGATGLRRCTLLALILACAVMALGAYVRLSDAGLSCPDWPGCYGHLTVPATAPDVTKAHIEMTHRYLAGTLGLLIVVIFVWTWRQRRPLLVPSLLLATVIVQALLGRWTVTGLLQPAVVTAHLLGGFTTMALLTWQSLRLTWAPRAQSRPMLRLLAALLLCAAAAQVASGGWTSANHAALACGGFPLCQGQWWPQADFAAAFSLSRPPPGDAVEHAALIAIHWGHRLGALTVAVLSLVLAAGLWRHRLVFAFALLALLSTQLALGTAIVLLQRPLAAAVAHSFCAAMLVLCLVVINVRLRRAAP